MLEFAARDVEEQAVQRSGRPAEPRAPRRSRRTVWHCFPETSAVEVLSHAVSESGLYIADRETRRLSLARASGRETSDQTQPRGAELRP